MLTFKGLRARAGGRSLAGDIVAITGIEDVHIGYTICDVDKPDALPPISVDEPTLVMNFQVNTSPLAGKEGKFVTSRQIRERLHARAARATWRCASRTPMTPDVFRVSGRGELHLTILIENMRREGYELAVGKPQVLTKTVDGVVHEPFEALTVDIDERPPGRRHGSARPRRAELNDMADRRPRPRAPRVPRSGARPDRLPGRVHDHDARHRPA